MPEFPGVFVEEAPAGARPIEGVGTSTAAFVGAAPSGPVVAPLKVHSFAEYEAQFGALAVEMPLGYAVQHFFLNGGREAWIARIVPAGSTLTDADLSSPALETQQRGLWLLERPPISTSSASRRCRVPPTSDARPGMPRSPTPPAAAPW